jgi:Pentapeptide repeats (8 copies)
MDKSELQSILAAHALWRAGTGGQRADLSGADLSGADLFGADLSRATLYFQAHALLAEVLRQAAGQDVGRRMVAGLVAVSPDWCWEKFLALDHPEKTWALGVLRGYLRPGQTLPEGAESALAEAASPE